MNGINLRRQIYSSSFSYLLNAIFFPLKMIIPQPIVARIPALLSNEDIRLRAALGQLKGRVLDIGCGNNRLIEMYRNKGGKGVGVDVHPWDGVDLLVDDSANLSFSEGSFDTVCFVASFNHIPNREAVIHEAHRVLSTKGRLVLTNLHPFVSRLWHIWNRLWDRDQRERGMKEGEVWGFTRDKLIKIFARNGFRLIAFEHFSWGLNQLYIFEPFKDLQTLSIP